jgi:hypothetical protein
LSDFPSISAVRFRWLLAAWVALSLIAPRQVRSELPRAARASGRAPIGSLAVA